MIFSVCFQVLSHLKELKTRCQASFSRKNQDFKALSSHTYVMTERGVQGHNGVIPRSPGSARDQYVAVATQNGSHLVANETADENFVWLPRIYKTSVHLYWAILAGLLTPLTFVRHRLSPLAAFTSGAYFLHNGRQRQWICEFYTANLKGIFGGP